MNRSIIVAALIISASILLNGYFERAAINPAVRTTPYKAASPHGDIGIAILPFETLSAAEYAGSAEAVRSEIVRQLTKFNDIRVAPSLKPAQIDLLRHGNREIGQRLGVSYLLSSSVLRDGNRIRVQVQLIDATSDAHIWAESYDRDVTGASLATDSEIAKNVADHVRAALKV